MRALALTTSGPAGGVALHDGREILEHPLGRGLIHGRELIPGIQSLLGRAGMKARDLDLLIVDVGPGSYTGLRVGAATARALCWVIGCPVVAVSSLDVLATQAPGEDPACCPVLDARRGELYYGIYERTAGAGVRAIEPPSVGKAEVAVRRLPRPSVVVGDGLGSYRALFDGPGFRLVEDRTIWWPSPRVLLAAGLRRYEQGVRHTIEEVIPLYLRPSEAERICKERRR